MHEGSAGQVQARILAMAQAGQLAGVTIINDVGFANRLVLPYVVLRVCRTDHDPTTCTEDSEARGRAVFADPFFWDTYQQADPRVILQYGNEENIKRDGNFYIGLMKAADEHARKVVIFNDSVGTTEDDQWLARRDALIYARDHGHYVGLHAYGDVTGGWHPMTAWDNPGAWRWFAGRFEHLYSLMPDVQPNLILTECGAGGFQLDAGLTNWLRDVQGMRDKASQWPYLKACHWWTCGGAGAFGFGRDCLDEWLPALAKW